MAQVRRRRKPQLSGDSEDLSDPYDNLNASKETQSSEAQDDQHDSEYDTAGSDSEASESQDGAKRESGDGQEEEKSPKKLDGGEDRRNPQYIPKRGTFYEHDDRTSEEIADAKEEVKPEREVKDKKVWKDKEDRWNHDRYKDADQSPKSREELIANYGYDIRNEEGPPRARRRRRYGRGPNKYNRSWEDENAYGKMSANFSGGKSTNNRKPRKSGEDFPALHSDKATERKSSDGPVISSAWYSNKNKAPSKASPKFSPLPSGQENKSDVSPRLNNSLNSPKSNTQNDNRVFKESNISPWKKESRFNKTQVSTAGEFEVGLSRLADTATPGRGRGRGMRLNNANERVGDFKPKGRGFSRANDNDTKRINIANEQQIAQDMKNMGIKDNPAYQGTRPTKQFYVRPITNEQRSVSVQPRIQQSPPQQAPPQQQVPPQQQALPQQQQQAKPQQQLLQQTQSISPLPLQQQPQQQQQQQPQQQSTLDASAARPKRYSTLRQRPAVSDNSAYEPIKLSIGYFSQQAGNSRSVMESPVTGFPPSHFDQAQPVVSAATPTAPIQAQPVIPHMPPVAQTSNYAPPAFLVPPPQFIPPQTAPPNILNFVPPPSGPAYQPNYQGYQGYNPTAPALPTLPSVPQAPPPTTQDLFQPQGCTYYNPVQQQQQQQPPAPVRRPKVAIPIIPPPDNLSQQQQQQSVNTRGMQQHQYMQLQQQQQQHLQQQHEMQRYQQEHQHELQQQQQDFQRYQQEQELVQRLQDQQKMQLLLQEKQMELQQLQHKQELLRLQEQQEIKLLQQRIETEEKLEKMQLIQQNQLQLQELHQVIDHVPPEPREQTDPPVEDEVVIKNEVVTELAVESDEPKTESALPEVALIETVIESETVAVAEAVQEVVKDQTVIAEEKIDADAKEKDDSEEMFHDSESEPTVEMKLDATEAEKVAVDSPGVEVEEKKEKSVPVEDSKDSEMKNCEDIGFETLAGTCEQEVSSAVQENVVGEI